MSDLNGAAPGNTAILGLLSKIASSLQRLEAEARDIRLRLGWPVAAAPATPKAIPFAVAPVDGDDEPRRPQRAVAMPRGDVASARMRRLRHRLDLSQGELAERLGVTSQMISHIESGRSGISVRLDEALGTLEKKA